MHTPRGFSSASCFSDNVSGFSAQRKHEMRKFIFVASIGVLTAMAPALATAADDGLVAWWKFHEEGKAALKIDGKTFEPGASFRQGIIRDADGTQTLIIWLKAESTKPMKVAISPA